MTGNRNTSALAAGFAAVRAGKAIVLLLAGTTIVLSLLAAAPLGPSLMKALAGTLAGDHILRNHPTLAPADVFDFLREKAFAVSGMNAAARWAFVIALLQQILFAGGIVSVLGKPVPFTMPDFVAGARRNLWHNLKCFLIFLLLAGAAIGMWFGAGRAADKNFFDNLPPGAWSAVLFHWALALGALFLYAVSSILHDFARAARRSENRIGSWRAYGHARRILAGRWPRALGIFLFWFLFGGALVLLGVGIEWSAPAVSALAIFLHILLQILVLTIRPVVRVAAWGSYLSLYDSSLPLPVPAMPAPVFPVPPEAAPLLPLEEHPLL